MTTIIVQTVSRLVIPLIQLFGLYVIIHGPVSPGGGFQGGVIVGASMILLALAFDLSTAEKRATHKVRIIMDSSGALLFAVIGVIGILAGGKFLEFVVIPLPITPAEVSWLAIMLIGVAIGIHIIAITASLFCHIAEEVSKH